METIKNAFVRELPGRFVFGRCFGKGDYLDRPRILIAKTNKGREVELLRSSVLKFVGGSRITGKKLNMLKGLDIRRFM